MKAKVKILVCAHKKGFVYQDDIYTPIQVGKALSKNDFGFLGDDTGDNISLKNESYCELTAIYWAWKNLTDVDYIGLCHYRRFFNFNKVNHFIKKESDYISTDSFLKNANITISENLLRADVILPEPHSFSRSLIEYQIFNQGFINFCILEKVILKLYPEYKESLSHVFYRSDNVPQRNMFIMRKDIFDDYAKWLFDILFEVEKYVKLSPYKYEKRLFGFMGEMLLPLYCYHNKLKIKKRRLYFISDDKNDINPLEELGVTLFNKLRFKLNTLQNKSQLLFSERPEIILILQNEKIEV